MIRKKKQTTLVLCSASPRREKILRELGVRFARCAPDAGLVEHSPRKDPAAYAREIARDKVRSVRPRPGCVLMGFDTVVAVEGKILGKPADLVQARSYLARLSGRWHEVFTGVCLMDADSGRLVSGSQRTRVRFRTLGREEIRRYAALCNPLDKAGAYTIEGAGALLVERIEGCYPNVVGLPVFLLGKLLGRLAVDLLARCRRARDGRRV